MRNITIIGLPAGRGLVPGLFGLAVLLAPCVPALAQPAPTGTPCDRITAICKDAGFVYGAVSSGNGLMLGCIQPIMQDKPQPPNTKLPLPKVNPQLVSACHAADPKFGQSTPAAAPAPADEEFVADGESYGWYDDGWNGPGWYIVGSEFRRGAGYGGPEGWHKWPHHGSHPHKAGGGHPGGGAPHHAGGGQHPAHAPQHFAPRRSGGGQPHFHSAPRHASGGRPQRHAGVSHPHGGGQRHAGGGRPHGGGGRSHGGGHRHSDIRLKHDIVMLGRLDNGLGFYRFSYNGSEKAYVGVMAQEVQAVMPEAVSRGRDGYLLVDYDRLGIRMETWGAWVAEGKQIPATSVVRH